MMISIFVLLATICVINAQVLASSGQLVEDGRQKRDCGGGGCGGGGSGGGGNGGGGGGGCNGGNCNGNGNGNGGGCSGRGCSNNNGCPNGNCNGRGGSRSSSPARSSDLSIRELLMILPFLSQPRAPVLGALAAPAAPGVGDLGAIIQLAKVLTKREAKEASRSKRGCSSCGGSGGGCNGGGGGCSSGNGGGYNNRGGATYPSRPQPPAGLGMRELMMLLPYLSQQPRPIPVPPPAPAYPIFAPPPGIAFPGYRSMGQPMGQLIGQPQPIGGRAIRQVDSSYDTQPQASKAEMRQQLRRLMMEEARRMASIVVTPHPPFGPNLAVITTTIPPPPTTWPRTTPVPASQIVDDYDFTPEQPKDPRRGRVSPGDPCRRDEDCVPGGQCLRGAVAGLLKYCVCKAPLMGFDGLCVMPGSIGAHRG